MERFVVNARRWPRVPARCRVAVTNRGVQWAAQTEDVGPGGCQLVSPRVIAAGGEVLLAIATQALAERLSVVGRVAWTSVVPPIRLGIAFAQQLANVDPRSWFERLLKADPAAAAALRRLPDRLPATAVLYLGQPPRFVIDFTAEELAVLRQIGSGARGGDIVSHLAADPAAASRAIFSLLARRALVLSRGDAVAPERWAEILENAASQVDGPVPPAPSPAALREPNPAAAPAHRPDESRPPPPSMGSAESNRSRWDARLELAGRAAAPPAKPAFASVSKTQRRPEAQALLEEAQREVAAAGISQAISLLRRALVLAPRDEEISTLLGQLAFRNRNP